jgi:hypothetical protein
MHTDMIGYWLTHVNLILSHRRTSIGMTMLLLGMLVATRARYSWYCWLWIEWMLFTDER